MNTNPRHAVIRKHLDAYEAEGRVLHAELADIHFQRERVTRNPVVRLTFGLLMWLDQREAHARKALAAWEARDAVAEAVALLNGGEA